MSVSLLLACAGIAMWPSFQRWSRPLFGGHANDDGGPLDVAYAAELLALALAGGAPTVVALETVSDATNDVSPATSSALARVAAATRWGVAEREAWQSAGPGWSSVASAFAVAARAGAAPSGLLRRAAADLRRDERERVAVAGAKAGVRVVLPLGLCFLPAFIALAIVPMVIGLVRPLG